MNSISTALVNTVFLGVAAIGAWSCGHQAAPAPKEPVNRNLWNAAWAMASPSQRDALKDGRLTFAEYEAAALRTAQCISASGVMQGEARLDPASHTYTVNATWQSRGDDTVDRRLTKESDDCYQENWNGINQAWSAMNQPTENELNEARGALADCLRDSGVEISTAPTQEELRGVRTDPAYLPCIKKVQEEFGIPYFGG